MFIIPTTVFNYKCMFVIHMEFVDARSQLDSSRIVSFIILGDFRNLFISLYCKKFEDNLVLERVIRYQIHKSIVTKVHICKHRAFDNKIVFFVLSQS